ncbi:hypothetical protein CEXT_306101 [Caerostris extrusa]|uniref:Uncharacterized protein n=1 Tax=Caerostris extrusa TaxID=172846 RepID=A0AAV4W6L0_CAEEX|nr:hypothetical protein CEXT_306101 [Caerostris extrusa]
MYSFGAIRRLFDEFIYTCMVAEGETEEAAMRGECRSTKELSQCFIGQQLGGQLKIVFLEEFVDDIEDYLGQGWANYVRT